MRRRAAPKANGIAVRSTEVFRMRRRAAPKATTNLRRRLTIVRSACDVVANGIAVRSTEVFR